MQLDLLDQKHAGRAFVLAAVAFAAGCASLERVPAPTPTPPIAAQSVPVPVAKTTPEPLPAAAPPPAVVLVPASPSTPLPAAVAKSDAVIAKPPVRPAAAPAPVSAAPAAQAAKGVPAVAATVATAAVPALDLKSLETRLRETKAIGVMSKLTLKNQVDDLLDRFRMFYQGKLKTTLVELRRSYDLLLLKVLALLQDADPPLASAIATSREAIWAILADPVKFATV